MGYGIQKQEIDVILVCFIRESERLLINEPLGCFLIRVSESRFGYTLSFRYVLYLFNRHYLQIVLSILKEKGGIVRTIFHSAPIYKYKID